MDKRNRDEDEAKLESLAKRLLSTPPEPREKLARTPPKPHSAEPKRKGRDEKKKPPRVRGD